MNGDLQETNAANPCAHIDVLTNLSLAEWGPRGTQVAVDVCMDVCMSMCVCVCVRNGSCCVNVWMHV